MNPAVVFLIVILISLSIFLGIFIPVSVVRNKYRKFVLEHSLSIRELDDINKHYRFKNIPSFDMEHSYDNVDFYNEISCEDYLIYKLVYIKSDVLKAINDCAKNKELFPKYREEIKTRCIADTYDTEELPKNEKRLKRMARKVFEGKVQSPVVGFNINVKLIRTNIKGDRQASKRDSFSIDEVKSLIGRINRKQGNYYLDTYIWDSIVRVERGRVTNRMRFAIYSRDGNRCRRCGIRNNLEIDHIIPIAKGGKSTIDNLQTLCHRCNVKKGTETSRY